MSKRKQIPDVMSQLQGLAPAAPPAPVEEEIIEQPAPLPRRPSREAARPRVASKNKTPRSRLIGRATYDIGPDLKDVILQESIELGVPASQMAKYLLLYAWDMYTREEIPAPALLRSDSPKFRNTIDFD